MFISDAPHMGITAPVKAKLTVPTTVSDQSTGQLVFLGKGNELRTHEQYFYI